MSEIKLLSHAVQNQIAAGEVVERPSSVLKELLDNACDAGADHVEIEISASGTELIRVTDNGSGIAKNQLPLATLRHATSKIGDIKDLEVVTSMGFRGEALASIASVSRFRLQTACVDDEIGCELALDGQEKDPTITDMRHPVGTSVIVRDLFFNIPVRREFLKSDKIELKQINDVVRRFALIYPQIALTYIQDSKTRWQIPQATDEDSFRSRLQKFMPEHFSDLALCHQVMDGDVKLRGYFAPPELSRSQADYQFLFVNNRPIKDAKLAFAIKRAYQELIFGARHSMYVLWVEMPPQMVDVNIHPRKSEVRFKNPGMVHSALFRFASHLLSQKPKEKLSISSPALGSKSAPVSQVSVQQVLSKLPQVATPIAPPKPTYIQPQASQVVATPQPAPDPVAVAVDESVSEQIAPILGYAIGQLQGIYVLAQNEQGLVVVDMHAAHERILLEKYRKQYAEEGIRKQNLLLAISITVTEHELKIFEEYSGIIKHLGFGVIQQKGELLISQVPVEMKLTAGEQAFRDLLADLATVDNAHSIKDDVHRMLATICCHRAIRKMRSLSLSEMNQLLRDIEQTTHSDYCNHGRPTWSVIPLSDLDQYFHRGQ